MEFCGGTHLDNTKEAATFCVVSEEGTAKGVRRITAFTREAARVSAQPSFACCQLFEMCNSSQLMSVVDVNIRSRKSVRATYFTRTHASIPQQIRISGLCNLSCMVSPLRLNASQHTRISSGVHMRDCAGRHRCGRRVRQARGRC